MEIPVTAASGQLSELVRRAEAGEDIVLTCDGRAAVRLEPVPQKRKLSREERLAVLEELSRIGASKATSGPSAARSQDFLYDERGLPK